ncbi:hypothetical protein HGRIS_000682 [Hohenbuehelia grisea]|uniref:DUF2264 domain-containing protein n=1 Tax=Hohenbuehelia grisea TaxID=104357 RepID=A0ABR3JTS3_9AGAR
MFSLNLLTPSTPFTSNPLQTRDELASFLKDLLAALGPHKSPGGARINLGFTGTHYDDIAAQLEGFARPLWGLGALLGGEGTFDQAESWVRGLQNGTDPAHEEFWGPMRDRDQRMVECSPIGFALASAPKVFWDGLEDEGKRKLEDWLGGMNDKEMPNTNWLWFRVFANLGLKKAGSSRYNADRMKADLDHLDTFYLDGGWSRDGPPGVVQLDYYSSSFAIQVAQLSYSKLAQADDPERCEEYRRRAREFSKDFVHYFDEEGRAIPFGRSMTYRFAMASFWGALAYADVELPAPLTWGVIKGLLLRNIRWWAHTQPGAFSLTNTFTIGYCYPNHNITENYNSPGSPYWAFKAFIVLALPPSHPFWSAPEEPYPSSLQDTIHAMPQPLHIASNIGGHTFILSSGQQCSYPVKQSAAKYGKLAYSSAFGYSVPVGSLTLEELGADNALALSDDNGEVWKCRRETREARIEFSSDGEQKRCWLRSMWYPWADVQVETWLVPPEADHAPLWHLRVHRIKTGRKLWTAEGGFAIYGQGRDTRALELVKAEDSEEFGTVEGGAEARAVSKAGVSGIADLSESGRKGKALRMDANTNLIVPRSVLPTLLAEVEPGEKSIFYVTGVFAIPSVEDEASARAGWIKEWLQRPRLPKEIENLIKL